MESIAEIKLRIIKMILETEDLELLQKIKNLMNEDSSYKTPAKISEVNEPVIEYKTEQQEREEVLAHLAQPEVAIQFQKSKEQAERGELIDNDTVHQEDIEWLDSL